MKIYKSLQTNLINTRKQTKEGKREQVVTNKREAGEASSLLGPWAADCQCARPRARDFSIPNKLIRLCNNEKSV